MIIFSTTKLWILKAVHNADNVYARKIALLFITDVVVSSAPVVFFICY